MDIQKEEDYVDLQDEIKTPTTHEKKFQESFDFFGSLPKNINIAKFMSELEDPQEEKKIPDVDTELNQENQQHKQAWLKKQMRKNKKRQQELDQQQNKNDDEETVVPYDEEQEEARETKELMSQTNTMYFWANGFLVSKLGPKATIQRPLFNMAVAILVQIWRVRIILLLLALHFLLNNAISFILYMMFGLSSHICNQIISILFFSINTFILGISLIKSEYKTWKVHPTFLRHFILRNIRPKFKYNALHTSSSSSSSATTQSEMISQSFYLFYLMSLSWWLVSSSTLYYGSRYYFSMIWLMLPIVNITFQYWSHHFLFQACILQILIWFHLLQIHPFGDILSQIATLVLCTPISCYFSDFLLLNRKQNHLTINRDRFTLQNILYYFVPFCLSSWIGSSFFWTSSTFFHNFAMKFATNYTFLGCWTFIMGFLSLFPCSNPPPTKTPTLLNDNNDPQEEQQQQQNRLKTLTLFLFLLTIPFAMSYTVLTYIHFVLFIFIIPKKFQLLISPTLLLGQ